MPAELHTQTSLCHSCACVRVVSGRLGQRYFRCTSARIPAKYPAQPVLHCVAYERIVDDEGNPAGG